MKNEEITTDSIAAMIISSGFAITVTASEDVDLTRRLIKVAAEIQQGDYMMHGSSYKSRRQSRSITPNDLAQALDGVFGLSSDDQIIDCARWSFNEKNDVCTRMLEHIKKRDFDFYVDIMHDALDLHIEAGGVLFDGRDPCVMMVNYLESSIDRLISEALPIYRVILSESVAKDQFIL